MIILVMQFWIASDFKLLVTPFWQLSWMSSITHHDGIDPAASFKIREFRFLLDSCYYKCRDISKEILNNFIEIMSN